MLLLAGLTALTKKQTMHEKVFKAIISIIFVAGYLTINMQSSFYPFTKSQPNRLQTWK